MLSEDIARQRTREGPLLEKNKVIFGHRMGLCPWKIGSDANLGTWEPTKVNNTGEKIPRFMLLPTREGSQTVSLQTQIFKLFLLGCT